MTKFGWLSPVAGHGGSNYQPIAMYQEAHILPKALPYFDSLWIADHFYGFDADKKEGFLEGWVTLTWLAAKFPDVMLCHHVLGHGYRNPALTAKMASTLQVLSGGRFMLGIGAGWRKRDIVHAAAVDAGRDPADIECCVTVAGDLPDDDTASAQWVERLAHLRDLGVTYFVMDFGHPLAAEPAVRFAEQVIAPLRH